MEKINNKQSNKLCKHSLICASLALVLFFILINPISAEIGCCFNPSNGLCYMNSEDTSCTSNGGEFYSTPSCSVQKCTKGCCSIGINTKYTTPRECELLSRTYGFEFASAFQTIDQESCLRISEAQQQGACLYGGEYEKECRYSTYSQCASGEFYLGTSCTQASLNSVCKKTNDTICFQEDVYTKDSCGNPDQKINDCEYKNGTICATKSSKEAYCKSLNCEGGKKNGASWCVDLWGEGGVGIKQLWEEKGDRPPVGSRYYRQYCLNGEIFTEPCADFRMETCEQEAEGAKCVINPWQQCSYANLAEPDPVTGSKVDEDLCDEEYCYVWEPASDDELIKDLHLELCVPNIKGGFEFYPTEGSAINPEESVCSAGTYESEITFISISKKWYLKLDKGQEDYFGNAGLLNTTKKYWGNYGDSDTELSGEGGATAGSCLTSWHNPYVGDSESGCTGDYCGCYAEQIYERTTNKIPLNGEVVKALKKRCKAISDCAAEWNWIGENVGSIDVWGSSFETIDPEIGIFNAYCYNTKVDGHFAIKCPFKLECVPWKAAAGSSECEKCGKDNLPCSEYRCKALGQGCDYYEPEGADKGYCKASNDLSAPKISCVNCPNLLEPFSPVEFTIKTDEEAECRFNMNNAGGKYSEMKYEFGKGYSKNHTVKLTYPGQVPKLDNENNTQYPALYGDLTKDLVHNIYVRCVDVAGNGETSSVYPISFKVMQTPDTTAPFLSSFNPVSGSSIKFNTTEKSISFKINEPSECKWDFYDKDFLNMSNNFSCDNSITEAGLVEGYSCSGILKNITLNLSEQTKFFIRCKDQPWLEGNESAPNASVQYRRNTNSLSTEYILRPSNELNIIELSPIGSLIKTAENLSFSINAVTSGGSSRGISECRWRIKTSPLINDSALSLFFKTNSTRHSQLITNPVAGDYEIEALCRDSAGNIANATSKFKLDIDILPPFISRLYFKDDLLKVFTTESAICAVSNNPILGCFFDFSNATKMTGAEKVHSSSWTYDKYNYIICKDYYNNYNSGCGVIIRTY